MIIRADEGMMIKSEHYTECNNKNGAADEKRNNGKFSLHQKIHDVVRMIPYGRVSTYGRISKMVGRCTARMVGYAMAALPDGSDVPWHRVINREGRVSQRSGGDGEIIQRKMLELEGVEFDRHGRVDLASRLWPEVENDSTPGA